VFETASSEATGGKVQPRVEAFQRVLDRARAARGVAVMGVCNVTPDSFSDGGRYLEPAAARRRVDVLLAEGADIVDVGGESTRPGAPPVSPSEQLHRVLDVVRHAVGRGACVSIDTADAAVARACLDEGACVVNDASALRDPSLAEAVAATGAAYVLMHTRGTPEEMRGFSRYPDGGYDDVVADVCREWESAATRARSLGVPRDAMVMDPGLGFAKNARQSTELLVHLRAIVERVGVPVAVGASRKSFLVAGAGGVPPEDRLGASIAAAIHAAASGAAIVRVHDVRATCQAIDFARLLARPVGS
jgi:dihydropteroate synthase